MKIVLVFCDKNNIPKDIIHNNPSSSQSKKIEKNEMTPRNKYLKSNEIWKDTTKNSYFSKYLEEYNRNKLIKKNNTLKQAKAKKGKNETSTSNHPNLSQLNNKKMKNNSVDKNIKNNYILNNSININPKKSGGSLNNDFGNESNKKSIISITPRNKSPSINSKNAEKETTQNNNNQRNNSQNIYIPEIKNLSNKEKAYLILSYSKCLRLCERMVFSRSTSKLRESISKKSILDTNKLYLNEKIKELETKIEYCNDKLKTQFNASKTAEMTLNFITSNIENEFKLNLVQNICEENDKIYFLNYIKLLYLFLDEDYEHIDNENLIKQLYRKISDKGYSNIKDYLYFIYIKNLKDNKLFEKIDKINDILIQSPDLLNFKNAIKYDRFISYTCYLFSEIVKFINGIIDTYKLRTDCTNYIEILNNKINVYKEKEKMFLKNNNN